MGVETTHPDRVLFPDDGITKRDVVDYYRRVAPVMVRHLRGRPLIGGDRRLGVGVAQHVDEDPAAPLGLAHLGREAAGSPATSQQGGDVPGEGPGFVEGGMLERYPEGIAGPGFYLLASLPGPRAGPDQGLTRA